MFICFLTANSDVFLSNLVCCFLFTFTNVILLKPSYGMKMASSSYANHLVYHSLEIAVHFPPNRRIPILGSDSWSLPRRRLLAPAHQDPRLAIPTVPEAHQVSLSLPPHLPPVLNFNSRTAPASSTEAVILGPAAEGNPLKRRHPASAVSVGAATASRASPTARLMAPVAYPPAPWPTGLGDASASGSGGLIFDSASNPTVLPLRPPQDLPDPQRRRKRMGGLDCSGALGLGRRSSYRENMPRRTEVRLDRRRRQEPHGPEAALDQAGSKRCALEPGTGPPEGGDAWGEREDRAQGALRPSRAGPEAARRGL